MDLQREDTLLRTLRSLVGDIHRLLAIDEMLKVVAKGGHLQHFINGKQTVDVTDETAEGAKKGVLALQIHAGAPFTVQFKDIVLKTAE